MKKCIHLLFGITGLTSCGDETGDNTTTPQDITCQEEKIKCDNQEVRDGLLILKGKDNTVTLDLDIEENLFGRFFSDRAEFFIIDNPVNRIQGSSVKSITMYYLDGQLCQTKYSMDNNIAERLIRVHGNFKISGYDSINRMIIKSKHIIANTESGFKINERLDNYELKWKLVDKEISFKVNLNSKGESFTYTESLPNYKTELKKIETAGI